LRVATYYSNKDIRIEDRPVPAIGQDELLVRVQACGICGSDVMEWYRLHKVPLVLGHELAGDVAEAGGKVSRFRKGDRVAIAHHVPCNTCHYCLSGHQTACDTLHQTNIDPGGFAEYARIPSINVDRGVFLLPPDVSFEEATFVEPLACVLRAQRNARLRQGQCVLVLGSGMAGLLHINLSRIMGAGFILATDTNSFRLEKARLLGADCSIFADQDISLCLRRNNDNRLADLVILCTGATTAVMQALSLVERGGTVLFFAPTGPDVTIPLSINDLFWRKDITLTTSYAGSPEDYQTALKLIQYKRVNLKDMITHRLGLSDTGIGFQHVVSGQDSVKVIIECQR